MTDPIRLDAAERNLADDAIHQMTKTPIGGVFDLDHLLNIHQKIFGDVYHWAGMPRVITISKGGSNLLEANKIESGTQYILDKLKQDNLLKGLPRETFINKLTKYYSDLNYAHPFREGNGRTLQHFMNQLVGLSGYKIDFASMDRNQWNEASRKSNSGSDDPLKEILVKHLVRK